MRTSYLLLGIVALLTACTGGKTKTEQKEFTLTGTFANNANEGKPVYLQTKDADNYISLDTATISNGTFVFKGVISENPEVRYISTESMSKPALFITEEGTIEMAIDTTSSATVKGTELNNKYQTYTEKRLSYDNEMISISKSIKEADSNKKNDPQLEAKLEAQYDSTYNALKQYTFEFAKENINNTLGEYILLERGRSFNEKQLADILPLVNAKLKENPSFKKIEDRFNALQATAVGQNYVNLTGKTPEGKEISLSEYAGKGNYVLIDFWASWCPPCRKEMPEVVAIYNQYKNKGFEIVGVSLDKSNEDWVKGIKDLGIIWPQMSDLKGWESQLSGAYAVNSIPHMVLLDKEGKIIARGINAHELSQKLAELLK